MNEASHSKFLIRKWNIVNDQSNANYDVGNEIIYHIEVLKSNLCDFNDTNILVTGDITIIGHQVTKIAFKSCAPLTKSITKIDGTTIADAEDLDLLMSMSNLTKYSSNYSETTGLLFYLKDEANILIMILKTLMILNPSSIRLNYWETLKLTEIMNKNCYTIKIFGDHSKCLWLITKLDKS